MENKSYSYKRPARKESAFEAEVKKIFEAAGWQFYKTALGGGFPDRMALRAGFTMFIELKAKGEKMRALQIEKGKELQREGFLVFALEDGQHIPKELVSLTKNELRAGYVGQFNPDWFFNTPHFREDDRVFYNGLEGRIINVSTSGVTFDPSDPYEKRVKISHYESLCVRCVPDERR